MLRRDWNETLACGGEGYVATVCCVFGASVVCIVWHSLGHAGQKTGLINLLKSVASSGLVSSGLDSSIDRPSV